MLETIPEKDLRPHHLRAKALAAYVRELEAKLETRERSIQLIERVDDMFNDLKNKKIVELEAERDRLKSELAETERRVRREAIDKVKTGDFYCIGSTSGENWYLICGSKLDSIAEGK